MLLGVDVGGTFTDAALFDGRALTTAKAPTTPGDESQGVLAAVRSALRQAGAEAGDVEWFAHGMTVGTNALLTGRGARTALVTTAGFEDLLDIARQDRPSLYELCRGRPPALVEPGMRFGARERVSAGGVEEELSEASVAEVAEAVRASGAEAVAICLLFAHVDPGHERGLAAALRERAPGLHVSASHEVLPRFREYERCSTTVIDAYLTPLLHDYLGRLEGAAREAGLPAPMVMKSSGGVAPIAEAARSGAQSVLSGPAGGAVGAALIARLHGDAGAVGLDMGGTSCDVCVVEGGAVRQTESRTIGGRVIQLPMVDIHTVGAGGGSVAWRDPGGALRVGPRSAGADPGPACYGRGGNDPTVTDANLLLGYLDRGSRLAGNVALDSDAAERAVAALGDALGLEEIATAEGIVRVANQEMVRALRVTTVERGVDPRSYPLLPFGGAGPMHAAAIAAELGISRLLCPRAGGVLSALGLLSSERRRDTARTVMLSGEQLTPARIAAEVRELRATIDPGFEDAAAEATYELRYRGQAFELPVPGGLEPEPEDLAEAFAAEHERRYSYQDPEAPVELVTIRLALRAPAAAVELSADAAAVERGTRRARFGGRWHEAEVVRGSPPEGFEAEGPCILELPSATLVLPPGWSARTDGQGTIVAEAGG